MEFTNLVSFLCGLLSQCRDEKMAMDYLLFWTRFAAAATVNDGHASTTYRQCFPLEYLKDPMKETIWINIENCADLIKREQIKVSTVPFSRDDYYYTDMSKEKGFRRHYNKWHISKHPVIAIFFPCIASDGRLKHYAIVEGNHRITSAELNHKSINVSVIKTILLPPDMFEDSMSWLMYLAIANFYEIVHRPLGRTSYDQIEAHIKKYHTELD